MSNENYGSDFAEAALDLSAADPEKTVLSLRALRAKRPESQCAKTRELYDRWIVGMAIAAPAKKESDPQSAIQEQIVIPGDEAIEVYVRLFGANDSDIDDLLDQRASGQYIVVADKWQKALLDALWRTTSSQRKRLAIV